MLELPLLDRMIARRVAAGRQQDIGRVLTSRFGGVTPEVTAALQTVSDSARLDELIDLAARCPDLDAFRACLTAQGI